MQIVTPLGLALSEAPRSMWKTLQIDYIPRLLLLNVSMLQPEYSGEDTNG